MTKKVCKSKCKCKKICIRCEHIIENYICGKAACDGSVKPEMNCVDGTMKNVYTLCEEVNKTGNCSNWKLDKKKDLDIRLKTVVEEYYKTNISTNYDTYCHGIKDCIVRELYNILRGNRYSNYFVQHGSYSDDYLHYKYNKEGNYSKEYLEWKKKHGDDK